MPRRKKPFVRTCLRCDTAFMEGTESALCPSCLRVLMNKARVYNHKHYPKLNDHQYELFREPR